MRRLLLCSCEHAFLAHQAAWAQDQDDEHDDVDDGLAGGGPDNGGQGAGHPDKQASEQGAGQAADAADDDGDEAGHQQVVAHVGIEADLAGRQNAGQSCQQGADREVEGPKHADVDPERGDGVEVEGSGANTNAHTGVAQEGEQAGHRGDHDGHHEYAVPGDEEQVGGKWFRQAVRDGHGQAVWPPDVAAGVLHDEGQPERQKQAVHRVAGIDAADHQPFNDEAEQRGEDGGHYQRAPEPDVRREHERDVSAQREEIAVREVDDVGEVEDQRQAQRHQHVESADDEAVRHIEQYKLQHRAPFDGRSSRRRRQAGWTILQPVSETGPAAFSPGTRVATVKTSSGLVAGGCTSPTKMLAINSWSPAR